MPFLRVVATSCDDAAMTPARNDLPSAVAVYRIAVLDGTWTRGQAEVLAGLQDDPGPLLKAMDRANQDPVFARLLRSALTRE